MEEQMPTNTVPTAPIPVQIGYAVPMGNVWGSFCQKVHTQRYRYYKSCSPQIKSQYPLLLYLTQTKGEADFKESGNNQ